MACLETVCPGGGECQLAQARLGARVVDREERLGHVAGEARVQVLHPVGEDEARHPAQPAVVGEDEALLQGTPVARETGP